MPESTKEVLIPLQSAQEAMALMGHSDRNLKHLRKLLSAQIVARGHEIRIQGDPEEVELGERVVRDLLTLLRQGAEIDQNTLEQAVSLAQGGSTLTQTTTPQDMGEIHLPGRLKPKTAGQTRYVEAIAHNDITFGIGPAGTGKTYLAVALAVAFFKAKKVKRIILTRPAVEAGEKLGFLPGDLQAKIDPYLRPLYDALFDMIDAERFEHYLQSGVIEVAPLAFMRGRAQPVYSKVLTPLGWREIGSLEPGDWVIGSNGRPTQVLGVYPQGKKPVFRVTLTDGASTLACAEHLWAVRTPSDKRRGKPARVLQTQELQANLKAAHQHRYELPLVAPVEFPAQDVPLDPYALGLLLGDGCFTGKTTPTFATADPELAQALGAALSPLGVTLTHKSGPDYVLNHRDGRRGGVIVANPLTLALRELGLEGTYSHTKFVPERYLFNSSAVRLAVLQGLLDADGGPVTQRGRTCRVHYTTTSERLRDDVLFLVRSLGGVARWRTRKAEGRKPSSAKGREIGYRKDAYILDIRLPAGITPFRLGRKARAHAQEGGGRPMRFVKAIEPAGEAQTVCIRVAAPDHLYVTEDFILTHNTLNDAFIILDEAQNTTPEQMKMFLTRMGFNSRVVITGDVTQIDLPKAQKSGLIEAMRILKDIEGIAMIYFRESDVVRHPLVARIVKAYEFSQHSPGGETS
nr:PhoH family protein [Calidithermus chliarophilus]